MPDDFHVAAAKACRTLAALLEKAAIDFESSANHNRHHPNPITSALDALGISLRDTARLLPNGNPAGSPAGPPPTRLGNGPVQQYVLRLPRLATADGMTSAEIADAAGRRMPNIHTMMGVLHKHGLIEVVSAERPRRWRVAADVACTPSHIVEILDLIGPDEWTTIGDISLALYGDLSAASTLAYTLAQHPEAMARCARVRPDATGAVPDGATSPATADRHRRVSWDELHRRRPARQAANTAEQP